MLNKKLSKKGFSLIELMVAVAIFAMAIFGIFHAYSASFMGMADAKDITMATNYAREKMEEIKNKSFDDIEDESPADIHTDVSGTKFEIEVIVIDVPLALNETVAMQLAMQLPSLNGTVAMQLAAAIAAAESFKKVTTTVSWMNRKEEEEAKTVTLETLIYDSDSEE